MSGTTVHPTATASEVLVGLRAFEDALRDGDLDAARTATQELADRRAPVDGLVEAFTEAAESGRTREAALLLSELDRRYGQLRRRERANKARALHARSTADLATSRKQRLTEYVRSSFRIGIRRAEFGASGAVSLDLGAKSSARDRALSTAETLVTAERDLRAAGRDVAGITDGLSTPPAVAPVSVPRSVTIPLDRPEPVTLAVENVGGTAASDVRLRVTGREGLEVALSTRTLGSMAPGDTRRVRLVVTGRKTGDYRTRVTAETAAGSAESAGFGVTVAESLPLVLAVDEDDDGRIDTEEVQRLIAHWKREDPVPGTGGTVPDVTAVRQVVELWASDAPVGSTRRYP